MRRLVLPVAVLQTRSVPRPLCWAISQTGLIRQIAKHVSTYASVDIQTLTHPEDNYLLCIDMAIPFDTGINSFMR